MDRDRRWERTKLAYDAIVHAQGQRADGAAEAVAAAEERGETDEFIRPTVIGDYDGVADGDVAIHFNFRPDRARQLVMALCERDFDEFDRGDAPDIELTTLTSYRTEWTYPVAFPPREPEATLAEVLSREGIRQLHVAETEKYAHVTYSLQRRARAGVGGRGAPPRRLARDVATYDERPEMSAEAAAREFSERWSTGGYRFGIINFANADMVGHTADPRRGDRDRGRRRVPGQVAAAVHESGGAASVTADHGNVSTSRLDGIPNTAHSLNPVPLFVTVSGLELADGLILADVTPTAPALLGLEQPGAMTGRSLLS